MSEETKNTAQEEETTDTPVTEETVENEPEVVENGEAETEEIPVEDGDEEASQDDKKDSKSKTSFFGKKKKDNKLEQQIEDTSKALDNAFDFMEEAFGQSQEMVVFVTELNVNYYSVWFIKENGCDKYYQYNRGLLFDEQQAEIMAEMDELERKF